MNFLLDENFPKSAVMLLTRFGHCAIDIREVMAQGVDDLSIFAVAQEHKAVLLTTPIEFGTSKLYADS